MRRKVVELAALLCLFLISGNIYAQFSVKESGAKGDGTTIDTRSIQNAIDKAYNNGGGVVSVVSGTYLIGTLILKDNVELNIQPGAVLLGSPDYKDYTEIIHKFESRTNGLYGKYFMIFAEGAKNISITGSGIINGNGLKNFQNAEPQNLRPFMIRLVDCENVIIKDVKILESANWTLHLLGCRDVNLQGLVIENGSDANRDGLDIDCCKRVTVSNSRFSTGDDAIVMKSSGDILCEDIAISNCIITTRASAIKTGTESNGGFRNITVSNCIIRDLPMHTGIELMTVDGGIMQNILIDNVAMENVATPFFIRTGIRARPYMKGQYVSKIGDVQDIYLNNITVVNAKLPSSIMGLNNRKIKNVVITNYTVRNSGKQEPVPCNKVAFEEFSYPMAMMFPDLPAYGLYCRNAEEVHLQNVMMYAADNEVRPALVFDRVSNLELYSVKAEIKNKTASMAYLRNSDGIVAGFCRSFGNNEALFVEEENSVKNLRLVSNLIGSGQKELKQTAPLPDEGIFDDFESDLKYIVRDGETFKGLSSVSLDKNPLSFSIDINKRGSLQLCLLMLNESPVPEKVVIKYQGIEQEFLIDWNEWGWAPVTLLKEYPDDRKVVFEISATGRDSGLRISRAAIRYQNVKKTD